MILKNGPYVSIGSDSKLVCHFPIAEARSTSATNVELLSGTIGEFAGFQYLMRFGPFCHVYLEGLFAGFLFAS